MMSDEKSIATPAVKIRSHWISAERPYLERMPTADDGLDACTLRSGKGERRQGLGLEARGGPGAQAVQNAQAKVHENDKK